MVSDDQAAADQAPQRLEARVRGHVQGVGFRAFVRDEARRLGLRGAVWNGDDRAVYVVAEGPRPALEALKAALHRGPGYLREVEVDWRQATGAEPAPFQVTR